jgi:hypothetical protein
MGAYCGPIGLTTALGVAGRAVPAYKAATARRGAGAVDRDGLENRCTLTGTVGSNPTLSATSEQNCERRA